MKSGYKYLALALCLIFCLAGCADDSGTPSSSPSAEKIPMAEVSDFTFDFETCAYSFTGAENATFYYIRVFPVVNGVESNSASFQSDKIDAVSGNAYSGTVEGKTLLAGDYNAYVMAAAPGYESSYTGTSGTSYWMAAASLTANWNTNDPEAVTVDITITAGDTVARTFTLTITDAAGAVVYTDAAAAAGSRNLTAADLGAEALTIEDTYTVSVAVNEVSGYKAPAGATSANITEARRFGPPG